MKRILSFIATAVALVFVASCASKPTEDAVKAEAVKNAEAVAKAIYENNNEALQAAVDANANAKKTLKIEKYEDLVKLYDETYDNRLEELTFTPKAEVEKVMKTRGIKVPAVSDATAAAVKDGAAKESADAVAAPAKDEEAVADADATADEVAEGVAKEEADATVADDDAVDVEETDIEVPFLLVEKKPLFEGKEGNEFAKWVNKNIEYPESAKASNTQGKVVVSFRVNKEGAVENVKVVKGVDKALDAEAVRVVSKSPVWTPGMQAGVPVNVTYTLPLIFKLN